jgi:hypothetical protein
LPEHLSGNFAVTGFVRSQRYSGDEVRFVNIARSARKVFERTVDAFLRIGPRQSESHLGSLVQGAMVVGLMVPTAGDPFTGSLLPFEQPCAGRLYQASTATNSLAWFRNVRAYAVRFTSASPLPQ